MRQPAIVSLGFKPMLSQFMLEDCYVNLLTGLAFSMLPHATGIALHAMACCLPVTFLLHEMQFSVFPLFPIYVKIDKIIKLIKLYLK